MLGVAYEVQATMIVVGSKGMHGAKRFSLGNVPNKISHRARCNVLIVASEDDGSRHPGHRAPCATRFGRAGWMSRPG